MSARKSTEGRVKLPRPYGNASLVALAVCILLLGIVGTNHNVVGQLAGDFSQKALEMRQAARDAGVPEAYLPLRTPEESRAAKAALGPWELKINSRVRDRIRVLEMEGLTAPGFTEMAEQYSTEHLFVDRQARLRVECKVDDVAPFDEAYFASIGGELVARAEGYGFLVAWIPAQQMAAFAGRPDVRLVMDIPPPYPDVGARLTEGDGIHNADLARPYFGIDGTGQFVGVISDGVDHLGDSQASGDAPGAVTIPAGFDGSGDEGTGMIEIVHDLAPGADIAFATGHPGFTTMINAINNLAGLPGMTVITDDLPKPGEPLFEDGPIAQAKQNAVAAGIFYTASAGNRGRQHHEDNFNSPTASVVIGPNTYAHPHDFGGGDYQLQVFMDDQNSSGTASADLYLQWADPFGSSGIDLDLFVVDNAGNVIESSTNPQTGSQDPNESVEIAVAPNTTLHIIVDYVGGGATPTVFFDLRGLGEITNWEYNIPEGSINGASRQAEVYAAGAAFQGTPNTIEGFSSRGPIRHFFPVPLQRMKPDATAVDGVSITGAGDFGSGTCPVVNPGDVCRFFGTSASTPHVGGLAALLLEFEPTLTAFQVATAFNNTAIDIDLPGPDNNAGHGRLNVFEAVCEFENEPPVLSCPADLTVECSETGQTPATDPVVAAWLNSATATDNFDPTPEISNDASTVFPYGETVVMWTAVDTCGNVDMCSRSVFVVDTTTPDLTCPPDITVECVDFCGAPKDDPQLVPFFDAVSATDICCDVVEITNDTPDCFPLGPTVVTFTATDCADNFAQCMATVTVIDTTPPEITVDLNRYVLWPPNHKMADIYASVVVTDVCCENPTYRLVSVTSNEPDNGKGDGNTVNDIVILTDTYIQLRSERSGRGDGRIYTITYEAEDCAGNTTLDVSEVRVPHDHSGWALASVGFEQGRIGFEPGVERFVLVVPSTPAEYEIDENGNEVLIREAFDATAIDVAQAYVGNFKGVVLPNETLVIDNNADGLQDMALYYPAATVNLLMAESTPTGEGKIDLDDVSGAMGLHYTDAEGVDYLVANIFSLGPPVPLVPQIRIGRVAEIDPGEPDNRPDETPSSTALLSARPNPFNPSTTIPFSLLNQERVVLRIYDAKGRLVRALLDDVMPSGRHDVVWNGQDDSSRQVATGVYFVHMRAGSYETTRKIVMIK